MRGVRMKVLIDIPEENYKEMCEYGNERVDFDLKRMIQNGTPIPDNATTVDDVLEQIRDEIEQSRYGLVNDGLDLALKIIDRHMKGDTQ